MKKFYKFWNFQYEHQVLTIYLDFLLNSSKFSLRTKIFFFNFQTIESVFLKLFKIWNRVDIKRIKYVEKSYFSWQIRNVLSNLMRHMTLLLTNYFSNVWDINFQLDEKCPNYYYLGRQLLPESANALTFELSQKKITTACGLLYESNR